MYVYRELETFWNEGKHSLTYSIYSLYLINLRLNYQLNFLFKKNLKVRIKFETKNC
jgi:hypothetical protein